MKGLLPVLDRNNNVADADCGVSSLFDRDEIVVAALCNKDSSYFRVSCAVHRSSYVNLLKFSAVLATLLHRLTKVCWHQHKLQRSSRAQAELVGQ
jgi:hypothetical protein